VQVLVGTNRASEGTIRQELLSDIREPAQFERLRAQLRAFSDEALTMHDYEKAAHLSNECRRRGVAGSGVDFMICTVAVARQWRIFTSDSDFRRYAQVAPFQFHPPSPSEKID
jgi:predicted nucleic acid-binding protein